MTTSAEIISELERRVAQRRQEGKYPPGLEAQLEAEFKAITDLVHRGNDSLPQLQTLLDETRTRLEALDAILVPRSHFPVKPTVMRVLNRVTGRRRRAITDNVRGVLETNVKMLEMVHEQLRQQRDYDVRQLNQLTHAMQDRLMMVDVLAEAVLELENKMAREGK